MRASRNDRGLYVWNDVELPSVTTIKGIYSPEHLLMWYSKMTATECAEIAERACNGDYRESDALADIMAWEKRMTAAVRYRDHKAAIGSITHHAAYRHALGDRDFSDDVLHGIMRGLALVDPEAENAEAYGWQLVKEARHYVASLLKWVEDAKPEWEAIGLEAVTVSLEHGYAGTMDGIAKLHGRMVVIDFKTSNQIDPTVVMQMEAYRRADFIGIVATGETFPIPETSGTCAIHVRPMDPCVEYLYEPSDEAYEAFLALRFVYGVLNALPKPNHQQRATKQAQKPKEKVCPF